jgi:hypothetical protein
LLGVGERGGWLPKWPWSRPAALIFGTYRPASWGRGQIVQRLLAKEVRISLPCLRKHNDPLCDYFIGEIGCQRAEGIQSHFDRDAALFLMWHYRDAGR